MAPRKSRPPAEAAESPVVSARVTKPRSGKVTKAKSNDGSSVPSIAASSTYRIKRYKNGILNLEKTPAHLVDVAKRNASDSPLLRLPAEIRNRIWRLAMGGQLVFLPDERHATGCAMQYKPKKKAGIWGDASPRNNPRCFDNIRLPAAFHLPETCRQVYSETVLTAYQQNDFFVELCHLSLRSSMAHLMVAQRRAITTVQIDSEALMNYMSRYPRKTPRPVTDILPNLKLILVTKMAVNYTRHWLEYQSTADNLHGNEEWQARILQKLENLHGDQVEVRFEEDAKNKPTANHGN